MRLSLGALVVLCSAVIVLPTFESSAAGTGCIHLGLFPESELFDSTGDLDLDEDFVEEARRLSSLFNIAPSIRLWNDADGPNAVASPHVSRKEYPHGTVYVGLRLLTQELYGHGRGGTAVAGILAHEFGHILQFDNGVRRNGKYTELHADYLAGWYLGRKNRVHVQKIEAFASSLYSKGDYNFWHPSHHGTPEERVAAMLAGFGSADLSIHEAYDEGNAVVRSRDVSKSKLETALFNQLDRIYGRKIERLSDRAISRIATNTKRSVADFMKGENVIRGSHIVRG